MTVAHINRVRLALIAGLAALSLGIGLKSAGRLTYHEAFVAQAAREMVTTGSVLIPTLGGRPWLEKPPLGIWAVALAAKVTGGLDEWTARFPSALAGGLLALGVAALAARRFSATVGLLAALVQITSAWMLIRGRLAEADMILACVVTWTIVAFDRVRDEDGPWVLWRWCFFVGLGLSGLVKGIGFGAVLIGSAVALVVIWDRDHRTLQRLLSPAAWLVSALLALMWPLLVLAKCPEAVKLWSLHVTDRMATHPEHFAASPWWQYGPALLWQVLPWTPFALIGAGRSLVRAVHEPRGGDRLLWAWAVGPVALLSLATVKNAHYVIYALPPWSVWAGASLARLGARLQQRGWSVFRLRWLTIASFVGLGLACGLSFTWLGPRFDHRGREWAFYEAAGQVLPKGEPLTLLYDDWDRNPYYTPFGPIPHDLGVRLFYLDRPACWRIGVDAILEQPPPTAYGSFAVIGRDRDVPILNSLGHVETLLRGPTLRAHASRVNDRTFVLFRVTSSPALPVSAAIRARVPTFGGTNIETLVRGRSLGDPLAADALP